MFKTIAGYPAYKINKKGKVISCFKPKTSIMTNTWREIVPVLDKSSGYFLVTLCDGNGKRQNKRVHRLIMETFVDNPNNLPQVNHIDGNKLNNDINNLEWCTAQRNSQHAVDIGLCDDRRKSSEVAVIQMDLEGNFIKEYPSIHQAGRDTGIAYQNISKVVRGIRPRAGGFTWKYK